MIRWLLGVALLLWAGTAQATYLGLPKCDDATTPTNTPCYHQWNPNAANSSAPQLVAEIQGAIPANNGIGPFLVKQGTSTVIIDGEISGAACGASACSITFGFRNIHTDVVVQDGATVSVQNDGDTFALIRVRDGHGTALAATTGVPFNTYTSATYVEDLPMHQQYYLRFTGTANMTTGTILKIYVRSN